MNSMKLLNQASGLAIVFLLLAGCGGAPTEPAATLTPVPPTPTLAPTETPTPVPTETPTPVPTETPIPTPDALMLSEEQKEISWDGWTLNWGEATTLDSIEVKQATYTPEQSGFSFLHLTVKMDNPTGQIKEVKFPKGPFFVTSSDGQSYELVGLKMERSFLMAEPYSVPSEFAKGVIVSGGGGGLVNISEVSWNPSFPSYGVEISSVGGLYAAAYYPSDETWYIGANKGVKFEIGFIFSVPSYSSDFVLNLKLSP